MTVWTLLRANTFRKPTRTSLTFVSLAIAFLLFMLLRAIANAFAGGVAPEGLDRVIVDSKYSMTDNLPLAHAEKIRALDEVDAVAHMTWFTGYYQDPKHAFAKYAVDPESYFDVMREQRIDPAVLAQFSRTRTGAVVSESLAQQFGWQPGDVITIESETHPKADGTRHWRFELLGTFHYADGAADSPLMLLHHDYFNEAVAVWARNQIGWLAVRVTDPERVEDAIAAIDGLFENSADPTRAAPEDEYRRQFARQLGDVGQITTLILGAVFFSLILLTSNTALQAFREQTPELAVMKTLGFSDTAVSLLVFGEAVLLCMLGAAAGIVAALMLEPGMNANLGNFIGSFAITHVSVAQAVLLALALGTAIGAYTAWRALRLPIVDALRED